MRIGNWEITSRGLPDLTPRESTWYSACRLTSKMSFVVFLAASMTIVITSVTQDDASKWSVGTFVVSGVCFVASYAIVDVLSLRDMSRRHARRIAEIERRHAKRLDKHVELRDRLDRARRSGDPFTMLIASASVLDELEHMRHEESSRDREE